MSNLTERAAYLQGLNDGLNLNEETGEGKLLKEIVSFLGEISESVADISDTQGEILDELEFIDEDLGELEDEVFGDDDGYDLEDDMLEIECPNCHDKVFIDYEDLEEDEITCPNCNTPIELEIDCDCDDDDCDCGK